MCLSFPHTFPFYDTLSWTDLYSFLLLYLSFNFELFEYWHALSFSTLLPLLPETRAMPDIAEGLDKRLLIFIKVDHEWKPAAQGTRAALRGGLSGKEGQKGAVSVRTAGSLCRTRQLTP